MTSTCTLSLLAILLVTTGMVAAQVSAEDIGFEAGVLAFPKGDPEGGRFVFYEFRCNSCHRTQDSRLAEQKPVAAVRAPELGAGQTSQTTCDLASSVISPSHRIGEQYQLQIEGELSPMGDFSGIMTVRQLIDLVAYLETLPEQY